MKLAIKLLMRRSGSKLVWCVILLKCLIRYFSSLALYWKKHYYYVCIFPATTGSLNTNTVDHKIIWCKGMVQVGLRGQVCLYFASQRVRSSIIFYKQEKTLFHCLDQKMLTIVLVIKNDATPNSLRFVPELIYHNLSESCLDRPSVSNASLCVTVVLLGTCCAVSNLKNIFDSPPPTLNLDFKK